MQNVFGVVIKDCDSVVHCTQSVHTDVLAGGDEFAAALESRVAHFELYDGVRIGDEESISEPQEFSGMHQRSIYHWLRFGQRPADVLETCSESRLENGTMSQMTSSANRAGQIFEIFKCFKKYLKNVSGFGNI